MITDLTVDLVVSLKRAIGVRLSTMLTTRGSSVLAVATRTTAIRTPLAGFGLSGVFNECLENALPNFHYQKAVSEAAWQMRESGDYPDWPFRIGLQEQAPNHRKLRR